MKQLYHESSPLRMNFERRGVGTVPMARYFGSYGDSAKRLVNRRVDSWKADELVARIECQMGEDLQFIR